MRSSSSSGSVKRLWRIGAFVLLIALLAAGAAFAAPAAQALGSIEGTLTAASGPGTGNALENISVYAFDPADVSPTALPNLALAVDSAMTGVDGRYHLDVANGTYAVWFSDGLMQLPPVPTVNDYVAQWYLGASPFDAANPGWTPVVVNANLNTPNIDDSLYQACMISGTVTPSVAGIEVYLWYPEIGWTYKNWVESIQNGAAGAPMPAAVTDSAGYYRSPS